MKCFRCGKPISLVRWSIYNTCALCMHEVEAELQAREEALEGIRQWIAHHPLFCADPAPALDLNDADREWLAEMHISPCGSAMAAGTSPCEARNARAHVEEKQC